MAIWLTPMQTCRAGPQPYVSVCVSSSCRHPQGFQPAHHVSMRGRPPPGSACASPAAAGSRRPGQRQAASRPAPAVLGPAPPSEAAPVTSQGTASQSVSQPGSQPVGQPASQPVRQAASQPASQQHRGRINVRTSSDRPSPQSDAAPVTSTDGGQPPVSHSVSQSVSSAGAGHGVRGRVVPVL